MPVRSSSDSPAARRLLDLPTLVLDGFMLFAARKF